MNLLEEGDEDRLTGIIQQQLAKEAKVIFKGDSVYSQEIRSLAVKIATASEAPVLITGESGTGKDVVARIIAKAKPKLSYVAVNCAAIPDTLFESELFGHAQGAFTGAVRERKGYLEQVANGVLFLDEVGEMPLVQQAKLLRVLQDRSFRSVGSNEEKRFTARVVAATNKPVERTGEYIRLDFFERISTFEINLEPIRNHLEDLVSITSEEFTNWLVSFKDCGAGEKFLSGNIRQALRLFERYKILGEKYITPKQLF
jgi:DNA-binding NtrC family response regulator